MPELELKIRGPIGSRKSAILVEIEIALKAIGVPVRYMDERAAQSEKNMTHADRISYIEMYKPSVLLIEESCSAFSHNQIIRLWLDGKGQKEIGRIVGMSQSRIWKIIRKYCAIDKSNPNNHVTLRKLKN